jgi:hypothetical protein
MDSQTVRDAIAGLVGKTPWDVRLGVGSFLTLEFGKRVVRVGERREHGEWHLWLYMCNWRLQTSSAVLTGSSDEHDAIENSLKTVYWGSITEVIVIEPALDVSLSFDSGHQLRTFSSTSFDEDQWILYTPDDMALTASGDGHYRHSRVASRQEPR